MIPFCCSRCQTPLKVKAELAGKRVRCSRCQQVLEVPAPTESSIDDATLGAPSLPPSSPTTVGLTALNQANPASLVVVKAGTTYQVEEEIARGGMGAVMRGVDQGIHREVAIKFLLNHADERETTRFIEEAQITGQLEHPNIVPVHLLGAYEDGRCFFSMKMVRGRSLADILKEQADEASKSEYSLVRLLNIFISICNALGYAHSRGIIHRDLKPANIMVGEWGEVYVMDWGLAKVLGQESGVRNQESGGRPSKVEISRAVDANLTQAGAVLGTPSYMPPEQAMGEAVDQRSDIYSLGAILYEILTLSPPVGRSGDKLAVLVRVAEGEIKPPEQQAPLRARQGWIPAELSAVAMKALARNPDDRYQSVDLLQRDIQLYLEGRSVSAKRDTALELFKKLVKRNKGVSAAATAALFVLIGVVSIAFAINYQERRRAEEALVKAEDNYQAFLKEQQDKQARTKHSAPAFLRAAQLMAREQRFEDALAQVNVALEYDPEQTEAWLLKGQVLIALKRYAEAAVPLEEYGKRKPGDALAQQLVELARRPEPGLPYLWSLYEVFDKQKALPFARRMAELAEPHVRSRKELRDTYAKKIDAVPGWAGKSRGLFLEKNGNLRLSFRVHKDVSNLSPIKGMELSQLDIHGTSVSDLRPLQGMPLTRLDLQALSGIKDLKPLRGMKLTWLNMNGLWQVETLEPLRGMRLEYLNMYLCDNVTDLKPLEGMPLTDLDCGGYGGMKLNDLRPLTGMKLKRLNLNGARKIKDIRPLRGMPLEWLNLRDVDVDDFEPLRKMPLRVLTLSGTRIRDLEVLKGMPLTELHLSHCRNITDLKHLADLPLTVLNLDKMLIRDLTPLAKLKLTNLRLDGCKQIENFEVLKALPLTDLLLHGCEQVSSLNVLRGLKLRTLGLWGCKKIDDLTPLSGMELRWIGLNPRYIKQGWKVLQDMKTLEIVSVEGRPDFRVKEFWDLFDRGEFK
jgi:serine/threonine protein kinase